MLRFVCKTKGVSLFRSGSRCLATSSLFLEQYAGVVKEREGHGIPARPLNPEQCQALVDEMESGLNDHLKLKELLASRVPPGVDDAARVKAAYLTAVSTGHTRSECMSREEAVRLLGGMQGGYNVAPLIALLEDSDLGGLAAQQLKRTLLLFDAFYDVEKLAQSGNQNAKDVLQSWADAEWFTSRPPVPEKMTVTVFKVPGETNTDDLSPAPDAWSRPDIPLHALSMLKLPREGIIPDADGSVGPITLINELKAKGFPVAYVGDVVGTGSSRKSATNSILWWFGNDIPDVPNKKMGGVCIGEKIAPIFYNTMEDSGALPIEMPVSDLNMGDVIDIYPYQGLTKRHGSDEVVCEFKLKTEVLLDEVQAGGRIPLIIGRGLTAKARESLGMGPTSVFRSPVKPPAPETGFTLSQKMLGRACGLPEGVGVLPGSYVEPTITTVGSQDTTGPMTRDELKDLACLGFSADLVMQSFCHTAAYPKPVDVTTHMTLPGFMHDRGGVSLKVGDGVIHPWLNRMLLPDTVGTGGDSHTRFPLGISFPAGSGLVAFAAATGVMPLDVPESVLVRFTGEMQHGVTLRDLVHAIPYFAIKQGLLTVDKKGKKNIFSGRTLEIQGLRHLTCEQAFELSDASAERSAAGCTIDLSEESVTEYLRSNIVMLKWMIANGYQDAKTLERRAKGMQDWINSPSLLRADDNAQYAAELVIDMTEIKEPVLCAPNDPDDARLLSEVAGEHIDEVFIGSCMTNIGHFRAAGKMLEHYDGGQLPTRLWIAPPTKMDAEQLTSEGYYSTFGKVGARIEMPGCSLCMGNQARVHDNAKVVSTSTRNFPNRLGKGADVFLASAELAAVTSILGRLPTREEYLQYYDKIEGSSKDTFRYLNFDQIPKFVKQAESVQFSN